MVFFNWILIYLCDKSFRVSQGDSDLKLVCALTRTYTDRSFIYHSRLKTLCVSMPSQHAQPSSTGELPRCCQARTLCQVSECTIVALGMTRGRCHFFSARFIQFSSGCWCKQIKGIHSLSYFLHKATQHVSVLALKELAFCCQHCVLFGLKSRDGSDYWI